MNRSEKRLYVLLLLMGIFILVACNAGDEAVETSSEQEAAQNTDSSGADEIVLSETYVLPGLGFTIDHPTGWFAETRDTFTVFSEIETDLGDAFRENSSPYEGLVMTMDQRTPDFMLTIGLEEGASLEDLFNLNKGFFEWQEPLEVVEVELFNAPALRVNTSDDEDQIYTFMGFMGDIAFLITLSTPEEQALDTLLPIWSQMLASTNLVTE